VFRRPSQRGPLPVHTRAHAFDTAALPGPCPGSSAASRQSSHGGQDWRKKLSAKPSARFFGQITALGIDESAAAESNHGFSGGGKFFEMKAFELSEMRFAVLFEYFGDWPALASFNFFVQIDESPTHKTDQVNATMCHSRTLYFRSAICSIAAPPARTIPRMRKQPLPCRSGSGTQAAPP
jgi:hypothetical protein